MLALQQFFIDHYSEATRKALGVLLDEMYQMRAETEFSAGTQLTDLSEAEQSAYCAIEDILQALEVDGYEFS